MIALLGGSGLDRWPQLGALVPTTIDTPYGPPAAPLPEPAELYTDVLVESY